MHQLSRLCLLITGITYSLTTEINPKPFGIPLLISWQRGGRSFAPTERVILGSKHKTLRQVAE